MLLGDRELPEPVARVAALLAPVLLSALVVTQTVGGDNELVLDARLAGVGAGAVAIAARAPLALGRGHRRAGDRADPARHLRFVLPPSYIPEHRPARAETAKIAGSLRRYR